MNIEKAKQLMYQQMRKTLEVARLNHSWRFKMLGPNKWGWLGNIFTSLDIIRGGCSILKKNA